MGDCREVMARLPENSVDAICTDPPYGIEFMLSKKEGGTRWDSFREGENETNWTDGAGFSMPGLGARNVPWPSFSSTSKHGTTNPTCADCGGRLRGAKKCQCETPNWKPMGKRRKPENECLPDDATSCSGYLNQLRHFQSWSEGWAKEALRVLKPGGYLLAFSSPRTYHRLACAVEDAGFEIRDKIDWFYGQGMSKSRNVSIDLNRMGEEALAARFNGYGTALKPGHEPIVVARKPLQGSIASNIVRFGTGAINIADSMVRGAAEAEEGGRWPSNVLISHAGPTLCETCFGSGRLSQVEPLWQDNASEFVDMQTVEVDCPHCEGKGAFPGCQKVGTQRIKNPSGSVKGTEPSHTGDANSNCYGEYGRVPFAKHGDADGYETIDVWACVPGCPCLILDAQSGYTKTKRIEKPSQAARGETFQGTFQTNRGARGHTDEGGASRFFQTFEPEAPFYYCAKPSKKERNAGCDHLPEVISDVVARHHSRRMAEMKRFDGATPAKARNHHPTVKPVRLMEYLIRLVMPPGGTLLDPFLGSGTTGVAAANLGVPFVGIEREPDYVAISTARIRHAFGEDSLLFGGPLNPVKAQAAEPRTTTQAVGQTRTGKTVLQHCLFGEEDDAPPAV